MKIYAFKLMAEGVSDVSKVLEALYALPLSERAVGAGEILRLEDMSKTKSGGKIFLDFSKARGGHGPGKISKLAKLSEIELQEGEEFGEDTGVLYDSASGYAAIQFNAHGPRSSKIAEYLTLAEIHCNLRVGDDEHGFYFAHVFNNDAYTRLKTSGLIKTLEFDVALPGATKEDLAIGKSLSQILDAPFPKGAARVTITVHAAGEKGSALGRTGVRAIIDDVIRVRAHARKLRITGKDRIDGSYDSIDFLEESVMYEVQLRLGSGRRYARQDRWSALDDAMTQWNARGRLR